MCKPYCSKQRSSTCFFLLEDPAYPLLPYVMRKVSGGGKNNREGFFSYKLPSTQNTFGRLKGKFGRLKRAMDIDINVLLYQVIMACLARTIIVKWKKKQYHKTNILSSWKEGAVIWLEYKYVVNEKRAKEIRNTLALYFEWDNFLHKKAITNIFHHYMLTILC